MAGIGFALRDLLRRDSLWSVVESHLHGLVAVAGPWAFTIVSMSLPTLLLGPEHGGGERAEFVALLVAIFSLTLVVTNPVAIVLTRLTSDLLYEQREDRILAAFVGAWLLALALTMAVALPGLSLLALDPAARAWAALLAGLVATSWMLAPMLSTLRRFRALTAAFAAGSAAFAAALWWGPPSPSLAHLLASFALATAVTDAAIVALLLRAFPGRTDGIDAIVPALRRYRELALGAGLYAVGIWIDKWWMWTAPEHVDLASGLRAFPAYDASLFIATVATVPALAVFVVRAETALHERCSGLFGAIGGHADLRTIWAASAEIGRTVAAAARDVGLVLAAVVALLVVAPDLILDLLGLPHADAYLLRFCALGAAFQAGVLMLSVVLFYFDARSLVIAIHATFLVANAVGTWATLQLGLPWYGVGYLAAAMLTFVLAWVLVDRALRKALFLAFVGRNAAVRDAQPHAPPADIRTPCTVSAPPPQLRGT